jgi:hypothetical protein
MLRATLGEKQPEMRNRGLVFVLGAMLLVLCSCTVGEVIPAVTPTVTDETASDYAALVRALEAAGATVEAKDRLPAGGLLFSVPGREFLVNHAGIVAAYAYADMASAEREASCIKGGDKLCSGENSYVVVDYAALPHFYKSGRILAEYVGMDAGMLRLLAQVLGPPFTEQVWP